MEQGALREPDCSALRAAARGLVSSLRAGGLGAPALAEGLLQTARAVSAAVAWGSQPGPGDGVAVRDGDEQTIAGGTWSLTLCAGPKALTISFGEPEMECLSLTWTSAGALSVERLDETQPESWAIGSDGSCYSGEALDSQFEQKLDTADRRPNPTYHPGPPGPVSGELTEFLGALLPGLATVATAVTATAVSKLATTEKHCPACQAHRPEGANFCPHCGKPVDPVCQCGRTFKPEENFCPNCGEHRP